MISSPLYLGGAFSAVQNRYNICSDMGYKSSSYLSCAENKTRVGTTYNCIRGADQSVKLCEKKTFLIGPRAYLSLINNALANIARTHQPVQLVTRTKRVKVQSRRAHWCICFLPKFNHTFPILRQYFLENKILHELSCLHSYILLID